PALDPAKKCRLMPGSFARKGCAPLDNETYQRQAALNALRAEGYDWVIQTDTDEALPTLAPVARLIAEAERIGAAAIEWPMRTCFQRLADGRFLEIRGAKGQAEYGYPGAAIIRAQETLTQARRISGTTLRARVAGDASSPSVQPAAVAANVRLE